MPSLRLDWRNREGGTHEGRSLLSTRGGHVCFLGAFVPTECSQVALRHPIDRRQVTPALKPGLVSEVRQELESLHAPWPSEGTYPLFAVPELLGC